MKLLVELLKNTSKAIYPPSSEGGSVEALLVETWQEKAEHLSPLLGGGLR